MIKIKYLFFFHILLHCYQSIIFAQNVSINSSGATAPPSAGLDIDFSNKGLLIPRVCLTSNTDITTIPNPSTSLLVFCTGTCGLSPSGFYYYDGSLWKNLSASKECSNGIFTRSANAASNVQIIPHGLSSAPTIVRLNCMLQAFSSSTVYSISMGIYSTNPTISTSSVSTQGSLGPAISTVSSTVNIANIYVSNGGNDTRQVATITVDSTNIYLSWTASGGGLTGQIIEASWSAEK